MLSLLDTFPSFLSRLHFNILLNTIIIMMMGPFIQRAHMHMFVYYIIFHLGIKRMKLFKLFTQIIHI